MLDGRGTDGRAVPLATTDGARRRPGHGLDRAAYLDPDLFEREQERIFRASWFFAGHACEVTEPGAWLACAVGGVPVVVVRGREGQLHALRNVCRHRGSLVCDGERGRSARLVCPYHAWTYGLDGALLAAPAMEDGFDRAAHGLARFRAEDLAGLIFVSLAAEPPPFAPLRRHLEPVLAPQSLDHAKVAVARDYVLDVNWKIVVENNRECYHCPANHPGYVAVQYDTENDNPAMAAEIAERLAECRPRWAAAGLDVERANTSSDYTAEWYRANRTPVRKGMVTESPDGRPACAVLMGGFADPDMGTARANTNVNFWLHANADYAHTVRITPVSPARTVVRGSWLVDRDAAEGRDYDPDRVAAFHDGVMREDWAICRRVWQGVTSPGYRPGPLSAKEANLERFLSWYVRVMSAA